MPPAQCGCCHGTGVHGYLTLSPGAQESLWNAGYCPSTIKAIGRMRHVRCHFGGTPADGGGMLDGVDLQQNMGEGGVSKLGGQDSCWFLQPSRHLGWSWGREVVPASSFVLDMSLKAPPPPAHVLRSVNKVFPSLPGTSKTASPMLLHSGILLYSLSNSEDSVSYHSLVLPMLSLLIFKIP